MIGGDYGQGQGLSAKGESLDAISAHPGKAREGVPRNALRPVQTAPPQRLKGLRLTDY